MNDFKYSKKITRQEIDDIMDSALRGISYWASEAVPVCEDEYKWASDVISKNGMLRILDDDGKWHELTRDKFLNGLSLYEGSLEDVDDAIADTIVQLALFGEVVYA